MASQPESVGEDPDELGGGARREQPPERDDRRDAAPPSLEGLPTSASLTAAEIELLKQVQELISPHAEGLTLPAGGTARGGRARPAPPPPQPHSPLDTPTVDLQQVMNWIMSVTPRAGANGAGARAPGAPRARLPTPRNATAETLRASTAFCFASF